MLVSVNSSLKVFATAATCHFAHHLLCNGTSHSFLPFVPAGTAQSDNGCLLNMYKSSQLEARANGKLYISNGMYMYHPHRTLTEQLLPERYSIQKLIQQIVGTAIYNGACLLPMCSTKKTIPNWQIPVYNVTEEEYSTIESYNQELTTFQCCAHC